MKSAISKDDVLSLCDREIRCVESEIDKAEKAVSSGRYVVHRSPAVMGAVLAELRKFRRLLEKNL